MENRLVVTSTKILRLFYASDNGTNGMESLTSKSNPSYLKQNVSLGTNEIIRKIGKDRTHISKSIKFLKDLDLLCEYGRWEEGRTKDTRLTDLGVEIAKIVYYNEEYKENISNLGKDLEETLSLKPKSLFLHNGSQKRVLKSRNARAGLFPISSHFISKYEDANSLVKVLAETWALHILRIYLNIISSFGLGYKKRQFLDVIIMNTIYGCIEEVSRYIIAFGSSIQEQKSSLNLAGNRLQVETGRYGFSYRISVVPD